MLKEIKLLVANLIRSPKDQKLFEEIRSKLANEAISKEERTTFLQKSHTKAVGAHQIELAYQLLKLAVEHDPENKELLELAADYADNDLWNGAECIEIHKKLVALDPDN
ncbi:hypothetical protein KJ865_04825, partial [Myxococcota bacterium]|nr:hypothetical protein [Myxococcota bacterium]